MPNNFVAIDFETAIDHHVCSVGIVCVENGVIVDEYQTLVQPPNNFYSYYTIQVHGITPEQTKNAPNFQEIYPELRKRLSFKKVVAHNESFDRNVLIKSMRDYQLDYTQLQLSPLWECTAKIYRKKGYKPAKLSNCCEINQIELQHHEALSDARACAKLYLLHLNNLTK